MLRTVEAVIDEQGNVHLLEAVQLTAARKALVTILEVPQLQVFLKLLCSASKRLPRIGTSRRRMRRGHTCNPSGSFGTLSFF